MKTIWIPHLFIKVCIILVVLCITVTGCDLNFEADDSVESSSGLSGQWTFADGWVVGEITIQESQVGVLTGMGRMTASPLDGTWQEVQGSIDLFLENTCPMLGSWHVGGKGGELKGYTRDVWPLLSIYIRLAEPFTSAEGAPGERIVGTLEGALSKDGRLIEGRVREIEGRLRQGTLDSTSVLLIRQSTLPMHGFSLNGTYVNGEIYLSFDVAASGECQSTWTFNGVMTDNGRRLSGRIEHSVYGSIPVQLIKNSAGV